MRTHDLIGIGFGPSNIALAIALEEKTQTGQTTDAFFIEKQPGFVWHKNMLLDHAHMQISFLKDLVTLRNPASRFTFINYLHQKQRLQDFINLKTFFPSRHEFNDYLAWAAAQFDDSCVYGEETFEVLPEKRKNNEITLLRVRSRDSAGTVHERLTRNLVVSVGGTPNIPDIFQPFKNDPRVFHSNSYLEHIAQHTQSRGEQTKKIAIVGAGQSAAEIFMDLHGRPGAPQVDLIMRGHAIRPPDDSPFANEIFNADFTDYIFSRATRDREALLKEFWHTNYAAPDLALIEQIFNVFYQQKVTGDTRHHFLRRHELGDARTTDEGIHLTLRDLNTNHESTVIYDTVVLATGYGRNCHKSLLQPLLPYIADDFTVNRHYQLKNTPNFHPAIFLQGACETTHGLSDTLLSVMAIRTDEIVRALQETVRQQPPLGSQHPNTQSHIPAMTAQHHLQQEQV